MQQREVVRYMGLGLHQLPHICKLDPTQTLVTAADRIQYDQYSAVVPATSVAEIIPSSPVVDMPALDYEQPELESAPEEEKKRDEMVSEMPAVSAPPVADPDDLPILSQEERVEFRDENGRILDEEEVAALEGKVSFKTRYETRTRIVDGEGHEVYESLVDAREVDGQDAPGVAPPHPEIEGQNPETESIPEAEVSDTPPTIDVKEDQQKERSVENEAQKPKPASEAQAATTESAE
jgi:dolichyl-phosphate-mannose-protein mannosyltransferase